MRQPVRKLGGGASLQTREPKTVVRLKNNLVTESIWITHECWRLRGGQVALTERSENEQNSCDLAENGGIPNLVP